MNAILSGLPELRITTLISDKPVVFEASWNGKRQCPHCDCSSLRTRDSFWRFNSEGEMPQVPVPRMPALFQYPDCWRQALEPLNGKPETLCVRRL